MSPLNNICFPSLSQWKKLPAVLSKKERNATLFFALCFIASGIFLVHNFYISHTNVMPARGGSISEGIVGSPQLINPIYSDVNDVDRDLVQLIFSGLFRYDETGTIVPDLAKDYTISTDGKTVIINLKNNVRWSDGLPLTANDIVYTINTIQDPKYKSPTRANWVGVDVQKLSSTSVQFNLQQAYAPFIERLTVKIIPAHIWQPISPENFALSVYNLQPVGSGPWRIKTLAREKSGSIKEIKLIPNSYYGEKRPLLQSLTFFFFSTMQELKNAFYARQIQNFSPTTIQDIPSLGTTIYKFSLPRYFALFFNLASTDANDPVKQQGVRIALSEAIDKNALISKLFKNMGTVVNSPFLPTLYGFQPPAQQTPMQDSGIVGLLLKQGYTQVNGAIVKALKAATGIQTNLALGSTGTDVKNLQACLAQDKTVYPEGTANGIFGDSTKQAVIRFQEKYAADILTPSNLTAGNGKVGTATRQKLNQLCFSAPQQSTPLKITITTLDQYPLKDAAQIIQQQWQRLGIATDIQLEDSSALERDVLKPRNFQVLLFGEVLGKIPDPFPFWHSSQKKDPGLNLSGYDNKKLDSLLEQLRKELDATKRAALLQQMQDILIGDLPIIPLYNTPYVYVTAPQLKGIETATLSDPSQRFAGITNWYVKTKRSWK